MRKNVRLGWTKVKDSNWTIDQIVKKTTLIGILNHLKKSLDPTDTEFRWNLANQLGVFSFYGDLIKYNGTRLKYLQLVFRSSAERKCSIIRISSRIFLEIYFISIQMVRKSPFLLKMN